ncbi:MAG: hypothetical protein HYS32_02290 [Candidatus Woesearchaeota archaeon]|nr:MAG: hypothetical protein HYS32_02290 [Candidatus Woesearchaeota archaeon]
MAKKSSSGFSWVLIIGVIIAIVLGLIGNAMGPNAEGWLLSLLVVLGLIVGFSNVAGSESKDFMMATIALVIIAFVGSQSNPLGNVNIIGQYLGGIFDALLAFVVPAGIVVALKDIWAISYR